MVVEGVIVRIFGLLAGAEAPATAPDALAPAPAEEVDVLAKTLSHNELTHFLPITILVLLALVIPAALLIVSWLVHRHTPNNPTKDEPYECGLRATIGTADERFSVKFYLIAMLFLVFDLEVAFLYPWAVHFGDAGWGMVGVLVVFLIMLEAGYLYLYRKGALDWDK